MNSRGLFAEIQSPTKIWAVGSIHSSLKSFESIKKYILDNFSKGDKLIFLGNIIGYGEQTNETLSSVINLRNKLMSKFKINHEDVIFLRGAQEEMFLKLTQLHTAPNPADILHWMFEHGVDKTIKSYGFMKEEILEIATRGTLSINKWTRKLNTAITSFPGHLEYYSNLKHAAFSKSKKILFVNRGVDVSRPLSAQNDCFWWGYQNFSKLSKPYGTFIRIVRGYEPSMSDNSENTKIVCSLYKGPLSKNRVIAGIFDDLGNILDLFESK